MGAGVLLYFAQGSEPSRLWLLAPWLPMAAAFWLLGRAPLGGFFLGLVAAALLGFAVPLWHAGRAAPVEVLNNRAVIVSGVVQSVDLLPEGRRVTLAAARLDDGPALARSLRLRLRANDPARPEPGDSIAVRSLVRPPAPPAYPGAWDFQRMAFFAGQAGAGFAIGSATVTPGSGATPPLSGLRAQIEQRVTAAVPGGAGAVAAALLTGGQSAIPRPDLAAMRDSGLAHLLSVSGLHIGIVMGLSFWLARWAMAAIPWVALRVPGKPAASLAALAAGAGYLLLTGSPVPMLRSFAMAAVVTLGVSLGRRAISMRVLAVAAVIVMLIDPAALLGPSFQMSFGAVLALIAGFEAMRAPLRRWRGDGGWPRRAVLFVVALMLSSVLAGAATTPYGLHHFGRLQLYGVAANAVAVPLTSVLVMPAGMLALAAMPLGLEGLVLPVMGWGVEAILWTARQVAAWPGAALVAPPLSGTGLAVLTAGLCLLCLWKGRARFVGVPLILAGLASGLWTAPPDVLVAQDGRQVALRAGEEMFLWRASGASRMTRETWLRSWGEEAAQALPAEGTAGGGALVCAESVCRLQGASGVAALIRPAPPVRGQGRAQPERQFAPDGLCGTVAVVIAPEPLRGRCPGSLVVDRFTVWRDGAHAVWLGPGGVRVLSDRAERGERPWVPPRPAAR
ncbi:competence protein ComEC [Humitalea rosea]|uniref:Competence protein ComEC n=1 Tax=Humitalea rosea TaxID=990373 RepID=A0A2W7JFJ3_9PROT|nr:ComEC/Rec2 family competence protein [Humitalea rosea]PZW50803.1 competence protein ComEC [Humitalea rosea]